MQSAPGVTDPTDGSAIDWPKPYIRQIPITRGAPDSVSRAIWTTVAASNPGRVVVSLTMV